MKRLLTALPMVLALAGCGGQSGSEYLGKWTRENTSREANLMGGERVSVTKDTLDIERNGDGYMIHTVRVFTQNNDKPMTFPEHKEPAVLKDGQMQVSGGLGAYVIDQKSGHLVSPLGGGDYTKAK